MIYEPLRFYLQFGQLFLNKRLSSKHWKQNVCPHFVNAGLIKNYKHIGHLNYSFLSSANILVIFRLKSKDKVICTLISIDQIVIILLLFLLIEL